MGRKFKFSRLWLARHSHLPLFLIAGVIIAILFVNEDTSFKRNKEYNEVIRNLETEIKQNQDSAQYYRLKYESLLTESEDMERVAREQYNMQRAIEDVYIVEE